MNVRRTTQLGVLLLSAMLGGAIVLVSSVRRTLFDLSLIHI